MFFRVIRAKKKRETNNPLLTSPRLEAEMYLMGRHYMLIVVRYIVLWALTCGF